MNANMIKSYNYSVRLLESVLSEKREIIDIMEVLQL